jgi:hypothetical protein
MVDTDPLRHPFTASYNAPGGGARNQDSPAAPDADEGADPVTENRATRRPQPDRSDDDLADRLRVDPDRGDVKG